MSSEEDTLTPADQKSKRPITTVRLVQPYHSIDQRHDGHALLEEDQDQLASSSIDEASSSGQYFSTFRHPRTTYAVAGCYFLAWLFAGLHYGFFRLIDGEELGAFLSLRQSHVSTISLLLVTAFRAAIVATLGICFTQYLWYLLRTKCLQVGLIEDLFQIRSNAWTLANPKIVRRAPVLFLAATLSWLVPLATVYPPTALTIQSELHLTSASVNASIMNPKPPPLSGEIRENPFANVVLGNTTMRTGSPDTYTIYNAFYNGPSIKLQSLAKLIMSTGQLTPLAPLAGENSSYALTFEGPRLQCYNISLQTDLVFTDPGGSVFPVFNASWLKPSWNGMKGEAVFELTYNKMKGFYPALRMIEECDSGGNCTSKVTPQANETVQILLDKQTMRCEAFVSTYDVNVSYSKGIQNITYTMSDAQSFEFGNNRGYLWEANSSSQIAVDTQAYKDYIALLPTWNYNVTSRAILDAVGYNLEYKWRQRMVRSDDKLGKHRLANGTEVELGRIVPGPATNNYTYLEDTVLNTKRFTRAEAIAFDPRPSFNITEASLNEVLANVTISALSLNMWYGDVTVQDKQSRNVYRFDHTLNFFLPYGLCLGLTAIFIMLGLNALRMNGISATDGGFLQIMMTTRGETMMSREVGQGSLGGSRNAPKELLDMKIRFGEILDGSETTGIKRYGFGTIEETASLRRQG